MAVFVIGNITEDLFLGVAHFPKPGETVLTTGEWRDCGGKGANQAVAAVRCGVDVTFVSAVGDDALGRNLVDVMASEGICLTHFRTFDCATDRSYILVRRDAENLIVSTTQCASRLGPPHIENLPIHRGDSVLLQGNLSFQTTQAALTAALEAGARTVLNAAPRLDRATELLPLCDLLIVNAGEAADLAGESDSHRAGTVLRAAGAREVIVTLGAAGARWVSDGRSVVLPAPRVDVVDTTGSGDVFCGVLVALQDKGFEMTTAIERAIAAASASVGRQGTYRAIPHLDADALPC